MFLINGTLTAGHLLMLCILIDVGDEKVIILIPLLMIIELMNNFSLMISFLLLDNLYLLLLVNQLFFDGLV